MSTSYSNTYGTGARTTSITVTVTISTNGTLSIIVDGSLVGTGLFFNTSTVAGLYLRFQFPAPQLIDEAKLYQSAAISQGVYKWQGSNDASSWTDIGSSFTLGGATTQTITALSSNTTLYTYYQLLGVSGSNNNNTWVYEIEFKIADNDGTSVAKSDTLALSDAVTVAASQVKMDAIFLETLTDSEAYARLDSIFLETLNESEAYARLDSIFLEILYDDYHLTDTLNNWLDAVSTSVVSTITPLSVGVSDSLNNWLDSVNETFDIDPLFASVTDTISLDDSVSELLLPTLSTVGVSDTLLLDDSVLINLIEPLFLSVDSDFTLDDFSEILLAINLFVEGDSPWPQWWDSVTVVMMVELPVDISDTLSFSDVVETSFQSAPSFGDSMTMTDSITWTFDSPIVASDSLNFWNDSISSLGGYSVGIFDLRFMADSIRIGSPYSAGVGDFFTLIDELGGSTDIVRAVEDFLLLIDEVGLTNWFYLDYLLFTMDDDYYRRWLNDRGFVGGEMLFSGNETLVLRDAVLVVRQ